MTAFEEYQEKNRRGFYADLEVKKKRAAYEREFREEHFYNKRLSYNLYHPDNRDLKARLEHEIASNPELQYDPELRPEKIRAEYENTQEYQYSITYSDQENPFNRHSYKYSESDVRNDVEKGKSTFWFGVGLIGLMFSVVGGPGLIILYLFLWGGLWVGYIVIKVAPDSEIGKKLSSWMYGVFWIFFMLFLLALYSALSNLMP